MRAKTNSTFTSRRTEAIPSAPRGNSQKRLHGGSPTSRGTSFLAIACLVVVLGCLMVQPSHSQVNAQTLDAIQDEAPVANAGPDLNVTAGKLVILNGSASTGFEGASNLNYTWNLTYQSRATILYGMEPTFVFLTSGGADVNLTVRDSVGRTSWNTANVTINEPPKTFLDKYSSTILLVGIGGTILAFVLPRTLGRVLAGVPVVSEAGREKIRLGSKKYRGLVKQVLRSPMGFVGTAILVFFILMAIFGPMLILYDVHEQHLELKGQLPSKKYWLGTDNYGIDVFSELIYGARTSITVGIVSALIASLLGAAVGLYSGYVGGWKDEVVMRLNDVVLSIPWLVLMIIVAAFVGKITLMGIILIIGLTGWSYTARMVRAQVLSIKERQYVERARAIGSSEMSIIRRHIFPNTFPLVFANTILTVAISILSESTLSFLGMRPRGQVTWGTMLSFASEASAFETGHHWWIIAPGLFIVIVVLGFTLLGYALDEILNPKLRHR